MCLQVDLRILDDSDSSHNSAELAAQVQGDIARGNLEWLSFEVLSAVVLTRAPTAEPTPMPSSPAPSLQGDTNAPTVEPTTAMPTITETPTKIPTEGPTAVCNRNWFLTALTDCGLNGHRSFAEFTDCPLFTHWSRIVHCLLTACSLTVH